jgi:hypothetical protein
MRRLHLGPQSGIQRPRHPSSSHLSLTVGHDRRRRVAKQCGADARPGMTRAATQAEHRSPRWGETIPKYTRPLGGLAHRCMTATGGGTTTGTDPDQPSERIGRLPGPRQSATPAIPSVQCRHLRRARSPGRSSMRRSKETLPPCRSRADPRDARWGCLRPSGSRPLRPCPRRMLPSNPTRCRRRPVRDSCLADSTAFPEYSRDYSRNYSRNYSRPVECVSTACCLRPADSTSTSTLRTFSTRLSDLLRRAHGAL